MSPITGNSKSSNIRRLEPLDVIRCAVAGSGEMSNLALALSELGGSQSFRVSLLALSRRHVWPRSEDSVWVWTDGGRPLGIASVRPRSGSTSWELSHLFADADHEASIQDLLKKKNKRKTKKKEEKTK
jgi:hypothetical protein